jgi:hypothetical protein
MANWDEISTWLTKTATKCHGRFFLVKFGANWQHLIFHIEGKNVGNFILTGNTASKCD